MNLVATPSGRKIVFTLLYLTEGAPIGYIWWALPTHLRSAGVSIEEITSLTALLVVPWMLKFLWAPLVDALRTPQMGYRAWIVGAQIVMGLCIVPLIGLDLQRHYFWVVALLIAHGFAAATQDVAIDGWAIAVTPAQERGRISGFMQVGMIVGRWFFGAGLLLANNWLSVRVALGALVLVILSSTALVLTSHNEPFEQNFKEFNMHDRLISFFGVLKKALLSKITWWGLLFATISGAGVSAVGTVVGPYLIDRGFNEIEVGWFYSATVVALLLGSWLGGVIADRWELIKSIAGSVIFMSLLIFLIAALDFGLPKHSLDASVVDTVHNTRELAIFWLLVVLNFCSGVFTAATYALFMHMTDPKLGGTQFSTYMGGINACDSWSSYGVGRLIVWGNYPPAFLVMAVLSMLSLFLLPLISDQNQNWKTLNSTPDL